MKIDLQNSLLCSVSDSVVKTLLADHSTNRNIVWATSDYKEYNAAYLPECEITLEAVKGCSTPLIMPRVAKEKEKRNKRTRNKAEVFTPSWVCNEQNNLVDDCWFGRSGVFNVTGDKSWTATRDKIAFRAKSKKTWIDYVREKRLEITCGEAPYLVSRYDTVTGEMIELQERIGLLDRKLRVVNENTDNEEDWFIWARKAYQSIYGYEYQGDSLLIARENLLLTFIDNMLYKFGREPTESELRKIAYIISWNIWQMDGLTCKAPYSEDIGAEQVVQLTLFDILGKDTDTLPATSNAVSCVIRDWTGKCYVTFESLLKKPVKKG